jgi:hypothetical protein
MKRYIFLISCFLVFDLSVTRLLAQDLTASYPHSFSVEVCNPAMQPREEVLIFLQDAEIRKNIPSFNSEAFIVLDQGQEIPSQYNQKDRQNPGLMVVLERLEGQESRRLDIRYQKQGTVKRIYPKRTQAELSHKVGGHFENRKYTGGHFHNVDSLRVPDEHTDHSWFIRYEGPGWESDKVGYRFYLDWRNGTDVFGKSTSEMVLQNVGQDGFDSYHELQPWGMDVLKVGKALGVGTLAFFHEGKAHRIAQTDSMISVIRENGNLYSSIQTNYYGWQVAGQNMDVDSHLSIHAGSRLTRHQVMVNAEPENLSTGLTKGKSARLLSSKGDPGAWGYMATYGPQSLNNDQLGLAILFPPQALLAFTEDEHSHVVKLQPANGRLEYYYLAAWALEPGGIRNEEEFIEYLNRTAAELANPVKVSFATKQ